MAFSYNHDNEGLFVDTTGLLGLGEGALSFPLQLSATTFSCFLVDRNSSATSTLEFGHDGVGYSSTSSFDTIMARLLKNKKLDVGLTKISIKGKMLSISTFAFAMDKSGHGVRNGRRKRKKRMKEE